MSCRHTLKCFAISFAALGLCALITLFSAAALASTNSGFDTPTGVSSLPFAVEGNEIMNLGPTGLAIGTTSAAVAPLDVSGGMRASNTSTVVVNGACSPEGMLGYDLTNHEPVYCNQRGVWTASGGTPTITTINSINSACIGGNTWASTTCPAGTTPIGGGGHCSGNALEWLGFKDGSTTWYAACAACSGVTAVAVVICMTP